jgi:hypothetical protein
MHVIDNHNALIAVALTPALGLEAAPPITPREG